MLLFVSKCPKHSRNVSPPISNPDTRMLQTHATHPHPITAIDATLRHAPRDSLSSSYLITRHVSSIHPCTPSHSPILYRTSNRSNLIHSTHQTYNYNHNQMASATEHYGGRPSSHATSQSHQTSRQTVKFLTAATTGASLLVLSGLVLTATVIGLVVATPLLVLFSPVLVPAAFALFLTFAGFVSSGGFGLAAMAALGWIYNYVSGKHPPGADKLDYARHMIADKARDMKERAKDYGHAVQHRVHDATHQTTSS